MPESACSLNEERRVKKFHNKKRPAFKRLESLYKVSTYAPESQVSELIEENRECVFDLLNKSLQHFIAIAMKGRTVPKGDVEKVSRCFDCSSATAEKTSLKGGKKIPLYDT